MPAPGYTKQTVLDMHTDAMHLEEIQRRTNLTYPYIESIIKHAVNQRNYAFDIRGFDDPDFHHRTRALLKDDDGDHSNR